MDNRQDRRRREKQQEAEYRRLMLDARKALNEDRLRDAEIGFREAAETLISAAEPHHMLALMAYQSGRLEEAGNHIIEATMRADDDPAIHADCGAIMNMLGRPAEAEAACRHVIDLDPDHIEAYNNLSVALSMQNRMDEALEVCDAALDRRPDYTDALINKANLLVKMDDPVAAIEAFAAAITVAPDNPLARVNLGSALRMVDELDAAEDQCRTGIELRPDYPEAHAGLGMVLAAKGDFSGAQAAFGEALRLRPGFAAAQLNLAAATFKGGDITGAEKEYRTIIDAHPSGAPAQTGLGIVLLAGGRLDEAAAAFRAAVDLDPSDGEAWMNLASALGAEMPDGDIARMTDMAEDTRLTMEQRIAIRFALGEIADKRQEYDAAFAHYEAANETRKAAMEKLGKVYEPEAMDALAEAIETAFPTGTHIDGAGHASDSPVFIVGLPRSGTTLAAQIIASHPDAESLGEASAVASVFPDYPDGLDTADLTAAAEAVIANLSGEARRVVDKTPFQFLHVGLIRSILPNAKIIHCRRDPLDTGLSCYFQNFVADYPWATDLGHIRAYMAFHDRIMAHWDAIDPSSLHALSYEALVADPEEESRKLIEHVGLDWDPRCLAFHENRDPVLTASSWQVRKPIYQSARGRAKHYAKHIAALSVG